MRKFYSCIILICSFFLSKGVFAQFKMNPRGYDTGCCALPYYLSTPDTPSTCFLARIHASLPEGSSLYEFRPQYVSSTAPTVLHLLHNADSVWLTFTGQGDWYENTLGYYTFPWGSPPDSIVDSMVNIVFPNATLWGYGGSLRVGYKVNLGHFSANTGIGFVIVSNGWQSHAVAPPRSIPAWRTDSFRANGNSIFYSDPKLNPASESDTFRHVVALYDSLSGLIVCGFEDRNRGGTWQPDNDFNDVLFYLTANCSNPFDVSGYPSTLVTCDSGVTTGGGSGLESQNLGGKVAQLDFENLKKGIRKKTDYKKMRVYRPEEISAERITGYSPVLERFLPATYFVHSNSTEKLSSDDTVITTPYYSTPTEITSVTTAKDVLAVDYVLNNKAKAAALAITTLNKPYNHTKSICDRFRGATLLTIDTLTLQGYKFIMFSEKQADGTVEYAITFDIGKYNTGTEYYLQSKWLISQYKPYDSVFNFQVWATTPANTLKLAGQILNNLQAIYPVYQADSNFSLPKTFISNGVRVKGNLAVTVKNLDYNASAQILLEENKTELAPVDTLVANNVFLLSGSTNTANFLINDGYQYEGHLFINGMLLDDVYMADGNWSIDYDHTTTTILQNTPGNESNRNYVDGEFPVYRSIAIKAGISSYLYAYKYLVSGDEPVDLSSYKSLKFHAKGDGQLMVKLIKHSIDGFDNQFHTTVALDPGGLDYQISFNDFYCDTSSSILNTNDIEAIVFAFNYYGIPNNLDFSAGKISFSPDDVFSVRLAQSKSLYISPNPSGGAFNCSFYSLDSRVLEFALSDITGRILYRQSVNAQQGKNSIEVTIPNSIPNPSLLMATLESKEIRYSATKVKYQK